MVIDIKMCRFDNVPWGFRLVGGADFEYPLTVVKVNEGSIAEEAGLRVGDVIVRINDTAASPLTHDEVNRIILSCGNVFYFGVYRDDEIEAPTSDYKHFPVSIIEQNNVEYFPEVSSRCQSPVSPVCLNYNAQEILPCELNERPCSVLSENTERKLVEDEIAAVLSGETEVLQEHNVLGLFPKPGVCMSSDVLRTLNEEATKTKAEKEKENKKWTTFLQKPNRPIPKSKAQIEAERRAANAYKVKITKNAPKVAKSDDNNTEDANEKKKAEEQEKQLREEEEAAAAAAAKLEAEQAAEAAAAQKEAEEAEEAAALKDTEIPSLEKNSNEILTNEIQQNEQTDNNVLAAEENLATIERADICENADEVLNEQQDTTDTQQQESAEAEKVSATQVETIALIEKTEEEIALEKQLADVQKQLAALSSLPSTIQATLNAVTQQLAELLPTFKLQQQEKTISEVEEYNVKNQQEENALPTDSNENDQFDDKSDVLEKVNETEVNATTATENIKETEDNDKEVADFSNQQQNSSTEQISRKEKRHQVIEELEEHWERKSRPKHSKRAFGPLTPSSDRPLVLPGGRRWYRPKDAYNDEFIAETLSAQAELITGTTLGVNFMKYQKPERKIDLNRSEVYKIIHHLDRKPVRGIEVRAPMVAAEADIIKATSS